MTVSDLLDILKITKQSLSRVLSQLVREGFIVQPPGTTDRRQRLLSLTDKGAELERRLTEDQRALVARAYKAAGAEAVEGFKKVLLGLINEEDRARFRMQNPASPTGQGPAGQGPTGQGPAGQGPAGLGPGNTGSR